MHFRGCWVWNLVLCMAAGLGSSAYGEWASQAITLNPGWNAVYLSVEPSPKGCEEVFSGIPIKSVWTWNKRFSPVQYVRDPSTLVPEQEEWLTYFPAGGFQGFLSTFHALRGAKGYLIELEGDTPVTLNLKGEAVSATPEWLSDSFNLVGFNIDPESAPTFKEFFAPAKELTGQQAYKLDRDGRWVLIENDETEILQAGEAYLVYSNGPSTYSGPLSVASALPGGLKFGLELSEQQLVLENKTDAPKTLTLSLAPSARSASGGNVALYYKRVLAWRPFDEPLSVTLEAQSKGSLDLAVRRAAMPDPTSTETIFENTLQIKDGAGSLITMPVSAQKALDDAGLYVGLVVISEVSEAGALDTVTPQAAASEFRFRLILHKDDSDPAQVHLLQHVMVMQVQPSEVSDPANPGETIVVPSRYVLLTDDALIPNYEGVALRDGDIVGRRISTPVFSFEDPILMSADASLPSLFTGVILTPYDDAQNPFLHRYHPDHNNLNEYYEPFENAAGEDVSDGVESYSFTRTVKLSFSDEDPENLGEIAWGYDLIGGVYEETISGVHKQDIHLRGTFRLNRISSVARLNDAL